MLKKTFFARAMLPLLFLVFCQGCAVRVNPGLTDEQARTGLETNVRGALEHGDWLVTRGIHATDNAVATLTNMALSHAAVYDAQKDEVIEADAAGVHTTSLPDFLAKSRRVMVLKPVWATPQTRTAAVTEARSHIGKGYNFTGLVGLNSPNRYYCTQLAIAAYRPFMQGRQSDPIPPLIKPGQMYHWGRIAYDSGP